MAEMSRERAADNLERIECEGTGVAYIEVDDVESLRTGAAALRRLDELEEFASAWLAHYTRKMNAAIDAIQNGMDDGLRVSILNDNQSHRHDWFRILRALTGDMQMPPEEEEKPCK